MENTDDNRTPADAESLLTGHLTMLKGYARHLLGSPHDADDLAQEVCVEALKNPQILFRGSDTGAYLRGIARHLAGRYHRRVKRDAAIEEIIEFAWELRRESQGSSGLEQEQQALKNCLEQMTGKLRTMILMRYDEGFNSVEIAQKLGSSSDAVRVALSRARLTLSKCVKSRLDGAEEAT